MRILIVTSCTGEKLYSPAHQLTQADFQHLHDAATFSERETTLAEFRQQAEEMYTGQQHVRLMRGVNALRQAGSEIETDLWILSAGYGLIRGNRQIVPYECTFHGMGKAQMLAWGEHLQVPQSIRNLLNQPYDLGLLLLGDDYLTPCQLDERVQLGGPTIVFCGSGTARKLPQLGNLHTIVLTNQEAKRFRCGLVALKGEVAHRLLAWMAQDPARVAALTDPATDVLGLIEQLGEKTNVSLAPKPAQQKTPSTSPKGSRPTMQPNPSVDYVIDIPDSWRNKPHRQKLRYFIPEWDDLVDRDYDFTGDIHSGGSGDWQNEVYAHQLYSEPNYDGILISKVVAEKTQKKAERINQMGTHRYLRVPRSFPVMGDCGAFGYIAEKEPPYTTPEILDYYTRLDFDYGVSIDHLIVSSTDTQRQFRYDLTIHNAEEFLREHKKLGLKWTPIGAVQGWDPESYAEAARQYVAMGYEYIALGGLVRTNTKEILRILETVHQVVPKTVPMHLFGLARLDALDTFARLGVHSVDSASFLRRAWLGTGENYLSYDGTWYAAIRIPEAGKSFRAKRMVVDGRADHERVEKLEKACMQAMIAFDRGQLGVDETLDLLEEYDRLITPDRPENRELLRYTLEAAPWKSCPCDICQRDGVQVVIFRGNNRNRRRGFHNTFVFYRMLQRALNGEEIALQKTKRMARNNQPSLFDLAQA